MSRWSAPHSKPLPSTSKGDGSGKGVTPHGGSGNVPLHVYAGAEQVVSVGRLAEVFEHSVLQYESPLIYVIFCNGRVQMWTMRERRKLYDLSIHQSLVHSGIVIQTNGRMFAVLQSREGGVKIFEIHYKANPYNMTMISKISLETHRGFCRLFFDSHKFLYPEGSSAFVVMDLRTLSTMATNEKAMPMTVSPQPHPLPDQANITFAHCYRTHVNKLPAFVIAGSDGGMIKGYDADHRDVKCGLSPWKGHIKFTPLGKYQTWESVPEENVLLVSPGKEEDVSFSPLCVVYRDADKTLIIGGTSKHIFRVRIDFDQKRFFYVDQKPVHGRGVGVLAMHPNQTMLVAGCWDGSLRVFMLPQLTIVRAIRYHTTPINCLLFPAYGDYFALAGCEDGQLTLWDLAPGTPPLTNKDESKGSNPKSGSPAPPSKEELVNRGSFPPSATTPTPDNDLKYSIGQAFDP